MSGTGAGIGTRTLRGVLWAYGSYVGGRILVLVTIAILARLLDPAEFGLVALALVFTGLLETVKDLGVTQALVVVPRERELERAETVFVVSLVVAVLLAVVCAALGPVAAAFFDEPELVAILPVLGLNFVLRALGSTHYALAQKRLDFRSRTAAEIADVLVRGVTGIALALGGAGAWALVGGYLAGTLALVVTLWILVRWRPSLRPSRAHLRELVSFGGTLTAVDVVASFIYNVDELFVGRVLGTSALGLYSIAWRLPELLIQNLAVVAGQVLFPAFASVDRAELGRAFLVSLRYTAAVAIPMAVGLAVLAEPFVLAAFGDKWRGAVDAMQVLAVYGAVSALGIPAGTAYKATGRARLILMLSIPRAVLLVVTLIIFTDDGLVAVAICQAAGSALLAAANTALAARMLATGLRPIFAALAPPIAAGLAAAAVLVPLEAAIDPAWPALLAGVAAGAVVYFGVLRIAAPDLLRDLLARLRPAAG